MSDDLRSLLTQAEDKIEQSVAAPDASMVHRLNDAVRRRRHARQFRTAWIGTLAAAAVTVGALALPALDREEPQPAISPDVRPTTPTPSPSPTTTPGVEPPAAPPARAEHIDDDAVIAHLIAPRTGEAWSTPEPAPEVLPLLDPENSKTAAFRVGQRGDATIYITADTEFVDTSHGYWRGSGVRGLFEVDAKGVRAILCPSARSTDPCLRDRVPAQGITPDSSTFYDTFTLPRQIEITDDFTLSTVTTVARSGERNIFGDAGALVGVGRTTRIVHTLGALRIGQLENRVGIAGVTNATFAILTPFGTTINLVDADYPGGDYSAIKWDDGVTRTPPLLDWTTSAAGSPFCVGDAFSVEDEHIAQDWRAAGVTPDGHRVFVPVSADIQISRAVRAWQEGNSETVDDSTGEWVTGAAAGYPFETDAAFHEAHALFAIQGPSGEWQLRIRPDAISRIYECS